jgi:hypothetical protein
MFGQLPEVVIPTPYGSSWYALVPYTAAGPLMLHPTANIAQQQAGISPIQHNPQDFNTPAPQPISTELELTPTPLGYAFMPAAGRRTEAPHSSWWHPPTYSEAMQSYEQQRAGLQQPLTM